MSTGTGESFTERGAAREPTIAIFSMSSLADSSSAYTEVLTEVSAKPVINDNLIPTERGVSLNIHSLLKLLLLFWEINPANPN